MKMPTRTWSMLVACLLGCASMGAAAQHGDATVAPAAASKQAQEIARGDPARWYREDATDAQRMRSRQKEINAALSEAKNACRQGPAAERAACMKEAQETWKQEISALRTESPAARGATATGQMP